MTSRSGMVVDPRGDDHPAADASCSTSGSPARSASRLVTFLIVALPASDPLDFSVFPSLLLIATLFRLSLNVASTRLILLHGNEGADAAGEVIEAFGNFVVGGNYVVGLIIFLILVIINFVVITKGAGRIAEVAARFTLDAMPGKQMAIDADLNAGLINENEARQRRSRSSRRPTSTARWTAPASSCAATRSPACSSPAINIVGGFVIGMLQHGMAVGDAAAAPTRC